MAEFGRLNAFAIHRRAVLRIEVLQQIALSFAQDNEMAAGKRFIGDFDISGFVTANRQRLLAEFPAHCRCAVISQKTETCHSRSFQLTAEACLAVAALKFLDVNQAAKIRFPIESIGLEA